MLVLGQAGSPFGMLLSDHQLSFDRSRWTICVAALIATLACSLFSAGPVRSADTSEETRAKNQEVLVLLRAKKFDEAETLAKQGLALCNQMEPLRTFCVGLFEELLGDIAFAQQRYSNALAYRQQSLNTRVAGLSANHVLVAVSQLKIGIAQYWLKRYAEAESALDEAARLFASLAPRHHDRATVFNLLSVTYSAQGRLQEAADTASVHSS
jgi:tetratricopeptide (TPR) repeat protein